MEHVVGIIAETRQEVFVLKARAKKKKREREKIQRQATFLFHGMIQILGSNGTRCL